MQVGLLITLLAVFSAAPVYADGDLKTEGTITGASKKDEIFSQDKNKSQENQATTNDSEKMDTSLFENATVDDFEEQEEKEYFDPKNLRRDS